MVNVRTPCPAGKEAVSLQAGQMDAKSEELYVDSLRQAPDTSGLEDILSPRDPESPYHARTP